MVTKPCKCGKKMIQRNKAGLPMYYPPELRWEWWCGGCGSTEGGVVYNLSAPATDLEAWEAAQE